MNVFIELNSLYMRIDLFGIPLLIPREYVDMYIAADADGRVFVYADKPTRVDNNWECFSSEAHSFVADISDVFKLKHNYLETQFISVISEQCVLVSSLPQL